MILITFDMAWSSLFKHKPSVGAQALSPTDPAQAITRARRRVVGAAVLLVIGVIGFPLVFETQPRPTPIDVRIEIPNKDSAPPLTWTVPASGTTVASTPLPAAGAASAQSARPTASSSALTPNPAEQLSGAVEKPSASSATANATKPVQAPVLPSARRPGSLASRPASPRASDAARAQALLDGKTTVEAAQAASKPDSGLAPGRFVVQMGAFADSQAAQELRQRAEQVGLKTYTQVVETAAGSRTRVRLGPFSTRADADKALARAKAAGLSGVVIAL